MPAKEITTRLGTAQAFLLACLLFIGTLPAVAQEDVAETKAAATIDTTPISESAITTQDRAHWAFQPIVRRALPSVQNQKPKTQNQIDQFILAKLETKNVDLAPLAARLTLLRRLSFDLLGLPPTPEQQTAFLADQSPDAYERLVDRLLASPAFGERYGQYWLDLTRFAETDGYEHDKVRPNAWRYRDWVISALNSDLPYDEFIRHQLAGDENRDGDAPAEPSASDPKSKVQNPKLNSPSSGQIASMFCLSGPDMPDINDQLERRHSLMNEMTATVGAVFLGLQFGCAQCHNHKYDPLSQADFYRLRAVFEPSVPALKRDVPVSVLAEQKDALPARFWVRGDHRRPGLEVHAAFPRIADSALRTPHFAFARADLATWLTDSSNPLPSRVIANRLWQWHFGRGLCLTPSDFGVMGGPVTHPELLDWLATDLREHDWSLKRLHREIVSSATYVSASTPSSSLRTPHSDESEDLYAYFPRQRLSAEAIRDAMLASAGLLTSERGGPGVMPPLPDELLGTLLKGQWTTSKRQADHFKRSIYVFARRNLRYPIFEAFDRPDGNATCPIRNRSTIAPQSLLLFNSEFSLLAAQHLAGRVLAAAPTQSEQVRRLYEIALSRNATAKESATLETFLADQRTRLAAEARPRDQLALPINCDESADAYAAAALVDACLALLNTSEFMYVD
jgi:hypothetical protein